MTKAMMGIKSEHVHALTKKVLRMGAFAALFVVIAYGALARNAIDDSQDDGVNPFDTTTVNLTESQRDYQKNHHNTVLAAVVAFICIFLCMVMEHKY